MVRRCGWFNAALEGQQSTQLGRQRRRKRRRELEDEGLVQQDCSQMVAKIMLPIRWTNGRELHQTDPLPPTLVAKISWAHVEKWFIYAALEFKLWQQCLCNVCNNNYCIVNWVRVWEISQSMSGWWQKRWAGCTNSDTIELCHVVLLVRAVCLSVCVCVSPDW